MRLRALRGSDVDAAPHVNAGREAAARGGGAARPAQRIRCDCNVPAGSLHCRAKVAGRKVASVRPSGLQAARLPT